MKNLGIRIKRKRELLGLQLIDLAKKVGVSASALSQIENLKSFPSIVTLKSIAEHLNTTVGELIGEYEALSASPFMDYSSRVLLSQNKTGTKLYTLSGDFPQKQMDTLALVFPAHGTSEDLFLSHHGQSYVFLIKGQLEFVLDGQSFTLKKYDSLFFNANRKHLALNRTNREAHLLIICSPPAHK